jgi:type IV pilus assembly protein PilW
MISSVIGIVLLGGIMSVFVSSKEAHHASASQTTLTMDATFAIHMIRQDVHMAGSFGWLGIGSSTGHLDTSLSSVSNSCKKRWYTKTSFGVRGFNNRNFDVTCIAGISSSYVLGTDTLVLRYAEPEVVDEKIVEADAKTLYIASTPTPTQEKLFLGGDVVLHVPIQYNKVQSIAYYISDYTDKKGDGYPSLRRVRLKSGPDLEDDVVVPGVEDMQILYGFDTDDDGSVNQYLNADNVPWGDPNTQKRLLSISISLLLVAEKKENNLNTSKKYTLADKPTFTSNEDHKFRRLIQTVLPLTNKLK